MNKLLTLTAIGMVLSTPVMAQLDSSEPEEEFLTQYECVKIAWENPTTLQYGEKGPMKHEEAEKLLAVFKDKEAVWGIYHFLVPSKCNNWDGYTISTIGETK